LNTPKAFETLMVSNSGAVSAARAGCIFIALQRAG
jgi:hypothetical protein